jgi:outer membrane protein assembly factor BamB
MARCATALLLAMLLALAGGFCPRYEADAQERGDETVSRTALPAAGSVSGTSGSIRVDLIEAGTIYAGSVDGMVLAIDAATGEERWQYKTAGALAIVHLLEDGIVVGTSHRIIPNSTSLEPITSIFALDAATGRERWSSIWEAEATVAGASGGRLFLRSIVSPLAIVSPDDLESSDGLMALDIQTGDLSWLGPIVYDAFISVTDPETIYAVLPVVGQSVYDVVALEAETGVEQWRAVVGSWIALRIVAMDEERVYAATGQVETMLSGGKGSLWAIDRLSGTVLWATMTGGRGLAGNSIDLLNGLMIAAWSDAKGANSSVSGIDAVTGTTRWTSPLPGYAHSGAVVAGGLALIGNSTPDERDRLGAGIQALDPLTGQIVWNTPTASIWAGVETATEDTAYVISRRTDQDPEHLVALDISTGSPTWQIAIEGSGDIVGLHAGVLYVTGDRDIHAVSDLHVYVGDDTLIALDAQTGTTIWSRTAAGPTDH